MWSPPHVEMVLVIDMIAKAIHKSPHVPRLMVLNMIITHKRNNIFIKDEDLIFIITPGLTLWPRNCHEPLI